MVRIDGETPQAERAASVRRFRSDPTCLLALLSITAAGTGLDFSAASAVVFAELPSDVGLVLQVNPCLNTDIFDFKELFEYRHKFEAGQVYV
jgi:hypothetical protein